uniref:Uncharacterized protein n=1 Tax=Rhizophora mucronata TaxID=61149 RepID=A0A2P2PNF1_RHIMU
MRLKILDMKLQEIRKKKIH